MSDFALFDQALTAYEITNIKENRLHADIYDHIQCSHSDTVDENGIISCLECGEQIRKTIMHEKEWRYYVI